MTVSYYWAKLWKKIRGCAVIDSRISTTSKIEAGSSVVRSTMDRYSFCGYDCEIIDCDIGAFSSIASNVKIGGATHPIEWVSTSPVFAIHKDSVRRKFAEHRWPVGERTAIGNDVWIGQNVLVKAGVRIGDGAVVGMGSVVTRDVPPYAVVAGCPATLRRMRFDDESVESLLRIQWWTFSESRLLEIAPVVTDIRAFLRLTGQA